MKDNRTKQIAIVTGASKGIGAAIAETLSLDNISIAVNYSTDKDGAERVVKKIVKLGGSAVAIQADVSDPVQVERLFKETIKFFGMVNIVVNNAGVYQFEPIEAITLKEFERQYRLNVLAPILTTQQAIEHFPPGGGHIVNISSLAGQAPAANGSLYGSTKAALNALTVAFAKELGAKNIRVNAVAAGPTETEGTAQSAIMQPETMRMLSSMTPLGRLGKPEDIAPIVAFLVSEGSGWLTGEILRAGGGLQ